MIFEEYSAYYIDSKKSDIRPASYAKYVNDCKVINRYLGTKDITEITAPVIREFVNIRLNSAAVKTVKCEVTLLKSILNAASESGLCNACTVRIKYPSARHKYKILNDDEFDRLYEYCRKYCSYINTVILIAMNTGMRIGEICALKMSDIDFEKDVISVSRTVEVYTDPDTNTYHCDISDTKTAAGIRDIPITEDFSGLLKERLGKLKPEHYIFTLRGPLDPNNVRSAYKKVLLKCGIEHLPFHSLRHSFATRMIERGVDPKTAAAFLGHSDCNITLNIYTNCTEKMKRDALHKMWG